MIVAKGSCLCKAVTYEVKGPLRQVVGCHCIQCQKTSGSFVMATRCRKADLIVKGDTLTWYKSSDTAERGFCSRCGSSLFWRPFKSENISIMAGTLESPTGLTMNRQIYSELKSDYYDLPQVPTVDQDSL